MKKDDIFLKIEEQDRVITDLVTRLKTVEHKLAGIQSSTVKDVEGR